MEWIQIDTKTNNEEWKKAKLGVEIEMNWFIHHFKSIEMGFIWIFGTQIELYMKRQAP